jgi:hypothetical protein
MNVHFRTFRLQPPHASPLSGHTSRSGQAWPPIRFASLSAVLRTSLITRSLVSRIEPYRVRIAAPSRHRCSADYPFTSSCSPPRVATAQLLSVTRREAPPVRDFHSLCTPTLRRTSAALRAALDECNSVVQRGQRAGLCQGSNPRRRRAPHSKNWGAAFGFHEGAVHFSL